MMTRSAQKRQQAEPKPIAKKPIAKAAKPTQSQRQATMRTTRSMSSQSANQSAQSSKSLTQIKSLPIKKDPTKKKIGNQRPLKSPKVSSATTSKNCKSPRDQKRQAAAFINPESPAPPTSKAIPKRVRAPQPPAIDTAELQSQESTSFEVHSARGADISVEALPSLASELEGLPRIGRPSIEVTKAMKKGGPPTNIAASSNSIIETTKLQTTEV